MTNLQFGKIRVLTLIDYYLPAFKAGGPLRTLANMVANLSEHVEFWIITRDRDVHEAQSFQSVEIGKWTMHGQAWVFYVGKNQWRVGQFRNLLRKSSYDILYLNSFFSPWITVLPLLLRRIGLIKRVPVIIAPRGEFSPSALQLKGRKKKLFIAIAKWLGLYRNLFWQASSSQEAVDIRNQLPAVSSIKMGGSDIIIAPDLLPIDFSAPKHYFFSVRQSGCLRLIFISRISPMKNLDFLLRVLTKLDCIAQLTIFGPVEDSAYWINCQAYLKALPPNVDVKVGGLVPHDCVQSVFSQHDLFVFPTRGENFGHIIFESLMAGTPVMVSDRTSWRPDIDGAIEILPLVEDLWRVAIQKWASFQDADLLNKRRFALRYAQKLLSNPLPLQQNIALFNRVNQMGY